ncbi:MAG: endonuclease/exonuclease/phosphatase family protein [Bacteroidota bacterium]
MINKIAPLLFLAVITGCTSEQNENAAQDAGQEFRVITYNVWYGFTKAPDRKARWIQWMQHQQPDVVSLQELNEYTPEKLAEDAKLWGHQYSELLKEDGFPTGVTSKYPIEDIHRLREGFQHGLLRVKIEGMYFYIIHLHHGDWEVRNREIDLILADIQKLPVDARILLAGDFNTFSPDDSVYYAHGRLEAFFSERYKAFNEPNLRDGMLDYGAVQKLLDQGFADLEVGMRPEDYTFTGSYPTLIEKEGEHGDQRRLDYVFANQVLADQVKQSYIVADDTTQTLSDHLPVVVDFSF